MLRTKTCGELRAASVGETATLCGWVEGYRDHGKLVFIDLRDRYGKTQIVFNPDESAEMHAAARGLRSEDVIRVSGNVEARPKDMINPKLATGEIDLRAKSLEILNKSKTPPFEPSSTELPAEELRLRYRFIDLRRPSLQEALILRHKITTLTRQYFDRNGFLEIETPMLGKSTPEGARDYLVPSRVHPGSFYALPQSPQIYKQILMVAGYDRYMQIARCFRDEDLRADRQPEFTQIDVEMAFVEREDILAMIDGLIAFVVENVTGQKVALPLPRYGYHDVMERFGSDKPDLRFGMELVDISDLAAKCGFNAFKAAVSTPAGRVRGLNAKGAAEKYSRKTIDELTVFVGQYGAKGLAFFRVKEGALDSPIAKFFSDDEQREIIRRFGGEPGDLLFLVADAKKSVTSAALAALRSRLGKELELFDPKQLQAAWVLDFPLVTYNEEEKRWDAEHHPFCYPVKEDLPYLDSEPGRVRAQSYDLVVNGNEAASGSVRIHDAGTQQKVFDLLGISAEEAEIRFGFLLEALRYGAPPHAGIALGLDRWVMMLSGNENIREVIAFPKTQKAADLLSGAPSPVDAKQLRDLRVRVDQHKRIIVVGPTRFRLPLYLLFPRPFGTSDPSMPSEYWLTDRNVRPKYGFLFTSASRFAAVSAWLTGLQPSANLNLVTLHDPQEAAIKLNEVAKEHSLRGYVLDPAPPETFQIPQPGAILLIEELVQALIGRNKVDYLIDHHAFRLPLWSIFIADPLKNNQMHPNAPADLETAALHGRILMFNDAKSLRITKKVCKRFGRFYGVMGRKWESIDPMRRSIEAMLKRHFAESVVFVGSQESLKSLPPQSYRISIRHMMTFWESPLVEAVIPIHEMTEWLEQPRFKLRVG